MISSASCSSSPSEAPRLEMEDRSKRLQREIYKKSYSNKQINNIEYLNKDII